MKILRKYVLKEFITPFILSLAVLLFIFSLVFLTQYTALIINKGVEVFSVGKLFFYSLFYPLSFILPLAIFTSVLWSMGRISSDNEITAIKAAGINLMHIVMPVITLGLMFSLFMVIFNTTIMPKANFEKRRAMLDIGFKNPTATLEAGTFIDSFQKYILFIYKIEGNKLENIRIYEPQGPGKPARTIIAKKGEFISLPEQGIIKLKLIDGSSDEPNPNDPNMFYKLNFKTYFINLNVAKPTNGKTVKKPKDMTLKELNEEIRRLAKSDMDYSPLSIEIQTKISLAFACLILALIGCPLSMIAKQRLKSVNLGLGFVIFGIYYLLILGAGALAKYLGLHGYPMPELAMWIPNIIFGLLGTILTMLVCAF
ncbi:MAG: hypothetical protein COV72_01315 [Candidatus Omnitrophica bacterium CG11_big_fil_rev_8_21_14_0_20_42_13]|uniref:Lipopolysaccharide export system permease protein LptF n=1 Tax=Candidatus Ghiorseimicrobium undicola TaxID=1974746 RepID=A0A2H0LZH2_9BACT|nr:MAG: hypothetical protein COV72_01315 [Candidatus Omnitrophica bacterium CG11_big_fil_rev_8_21_14_0_20_42_13]